MKILILVCIFSVAKAYGAIPVHKVEKTIEIGQKSLIIDGNSIPHSCPHENKYKTFASVKIGHFMLNLQCHRDYLGGITMKSSPKIRLAGLSGDAGSVWGEISKVEYSNKKLKLYRMIFTKNDPSVDCEYVPPESSEKFKLFCKKAKVKCSTTYQEFIFNGTQFINSRKNITKEPTSFSLGFPKNLSKNCGKLWNENVLKK